MDAQADGLLARGVCSKLPLAPDARRGLLFCGSRVGAVAVVDCRGRAVASELRARVREDGVYALSLCPRGRWLAAGCGGGEVAVWEVERALETVPGYSERVWHAHGGGVFAVAWHHSGALLASGGRDCHIAFWDAEGRPRGRVGGHSDWVRAVAAHPAADLLASGGCDTTVRVWRFELGEYNRAPLRITHRGHALPVSAIAASDALIASLARDGELRLWDWRAPGCLRVLDATMRNGSVYLGSLAWRGRELLARDGEGVVHLWETHADPARWRHAGALAVRARDLGVALLAPGAAVLGSPTALRLARFRAPARRAARRRPAARL